MLNHVLPQFVAAAFTGNFYFGAFAQVVLNFMIFNIVLPPRPLPFDFLVELNLIFVVPQLLASLLGISVQRSVNLPPVLEVSLPWESCQDAWSWLTWLRAASSVVLLTAISGVSYDFGVSVWTPGNFVLWGLVASAELVILYVVVYFILRYDVGKQLPFTSERQLRRFLVLMFLLEIFFINVWWPFNTQFQRATELIGVMLGLIVVSFLVAVGVYLYLRNAYPGMTRAETIHNVTYYHGERAKCKISPLSSVNGRAGTATARGNTHNEHEVLRLPSDSRSSDADRVKK